MEFEFLLIVDGVSIDDDPAMTVLAEQFDAVVSDSRGVVRVAVSAEGIDSINALSSLVVRLATAVPSLRVMRLDLDLVGISDIAERTNRSRQNVQQWVDGDRHLGGGPFPYPEGTVGRSLVWRWSDVYAWLRLLGLVEDEHILDRADMVVLEMFLLQWRQSRAQGMPMIRTTFVGGDDRTADRMQVANAINTSASVGDPQLTAALLQLPRANQHQITIVCAVLLDRLAFIVGQLGGEAAGVIAVMAGESEVRLLPIASVLLPGSVPISDFGLGLDATVGDLVLALDHSLVGPTTPLRVSS